MAERRRCAFVYDFAMASFTISEVAGRIGIRSSAIRYYEQIGLLPPAQRISGKRRYDPTALYRLILIQRARQTGFTLPEIKTLFYGFRAGTLPSIRWQKLKRQKMIALDALAERIESMRRFLERQGECSCSALEECGKKIFEKQCATTTAKLPLKKRSLLGFASPIGPTRPR
jgi:MerR family redox-sensitive transcriptional activator SoxR